MKLGYWLAAVAGMVLATSAAATTVTYTESLAPVSADVHTSLSAPLFGLAFKSLKSVVITLEYDIQAGAVGTKPGGGTHSGAVTNGSNNATTATLVMSSSLTGSSGTGDPEALVRALSADTPITLASTANLSIAKRNLAYFDSADASHILMLSATETLLNTSAAADLAAFMGTGNFSLNLNSRTTLALTGKGLLNQDVGVVVGALLQVAYTYENQVSPSYFSPGGGPAQDSSRVPEPATGSLALAALVLAGRLRKGRSRLPRVG